MMFRFHMFCTETVIQYACKYGSVVIEIMFCTHILEHTNINNAQQVNFSRKYGAVDAGC